VEKGVEPFGVLKRSWRALTLSLAMWKRE